MRFISKNIIYLNLSKVKLKSFDIIVQLWDLIEECHFMEELVLNDCWITYGSHIKKIMLSFKELYRLKTVSMVQSFTKDQCLMIMDQIDDVIIDPLWKISALPNSLLLTIQKSNLTANLMKLIKNLNKIST